jgi:hypothetical protein
VRAIVLIFVLAELTRHARRHLGTNPDPVSLLDAGHCLAHVDDLAYDFVAYAEWPFEVAPASGDCVHIGSADAAALDLDIDIVVFERLRLEVLLLELLPCLGRLDAITAKCVRVAHVV